MCYNPAIRKAVEETTEHNRLKHITKNAPIGNPVDRIGKQKVRPRI